MRHSENYELNLVEGSDIVNPLVQDVPNYEAIDAAMFDNKEHSVGVATELKTGTVHALTRQNADAAVFRFTATSDYTVGDTFEVDGVQVSALLVDGTTLSNRCYIIGSEVLASLKGTLLTVYANRTTASDADKLGGQLPDYYATDADLDSLEGVVDAHTEQIRQINSDLTANDISSDITFTNGATSDIVKAFEQNGYKNINAVIKFPMGVSAGFDGTITTNTPFKQYCCACGYVLGTNNNVLVYSSNGTIRLYTSSAIPNDNNVYFSLNGY